MNLKTNIFFNSNPQRHKKKRKLEKPKYLEEDEISDENTTIYTDLFNNRHRGYTAFSKITKSEIEDYLQIPAIQWKKWEGILDEFPKDCNIDEKDLRERIEAVLETSPASTFDHTHASKCKLFDTVLEPCLLKTENLIVNNERLADLSEGEIQDSEGEEFQLTPLAPTIEIKTEVNHSHLFQLLAIMRAAQFVNYTSIRFESSEVYGLLTDCYVWIFVKIVFDGLKVKSVHYSHRYLMDLSNGIIDMQIVNVLHQMCKKADDAISSFKSTSTNLVTYFPISKWSSSDLCYWLSKEFPGIPPTTITTLRNENVDGKQLLEMDRDMLLEYGIPKYIATKVTTVELHLTTDGSITISENTILEKKNVLLWTNKEVHEIFSSPVTKGGLEIEQDVKLDGKTLYRLAQELITRPGELIEKIDKVATFIQLDSLISVGIVRWIVTNLLEKRICGNLLE